jgi:hypothetical protein
MHNKVISKNVTEIYTFFTFTQVSRTCLAFNIFGALFDLFKKIFVGHLITLSKRQTCKNGSKNQKNLVSNCVLDFNFALIKRSVFFSKNLLYPTTHPPPPPPWSSPRPSLYNCITVRLKIHV